MKFKDIEVGQWFYIADQGDIYYKVGNKPQLGLCKSFGNNGAVIRKLFIVLDKKGFGYIHAFRNLDMEVILTDPPENL